MNETKKESRVHSWLAAILGGALATVLSTYLLYILPPEKILFSGSQPVANLQGQSQEGWAYLGTFENGGWSKGTVAVGPRLPNVGDRIKLTKPLNLRIAKPIWPFYHLGDVAARLTKGEMVEVLKVDQDVGRHRVWALVSCRRP
jgi:hypothetical protein